jgi:RNA polymerase subunit RPABC4/transcription elongation factor Spt4
MRAMMSEISTDIKKSLIAPCGMNCLLCLAYEREKRPCPGCRNIDINDKGSRVRCIIKKCEYLMETDSGFCYECEKYPCRRMRQLDKRYRTRYSMSMLENLAYIKQHGMKDFIMQEDKRWTCPQCGSFLSVHRDSCLSCGSKWR